MSTKQANDAPVLRYDGYDITFQEVPHEVSLVLNITACTGHCRGCHSPWLRRDYGRPVLDDLPGLIKKYTGLITCVCFLGEGRNPAALASCVDMVRRNGLKSCVYSGRDQNRWELYRSDYFKYGSYREDKGPLNSPTTNQRFLFYPDAPDSPDPVDITCLFRSKNM